MDLFNESEMYAILQCFWQLLGASPSQEESAFIKKMISNWRLKYSWEVHAIEQDPYKSFKCVATMDEEKRKIFKKMIVEIVESEGDNNLKTKMAVALFEKTNIPYAIIARNELVYNPYNKGEYEIL